MGRLKLNKRRPQCLKKPTRHKESFRSGTSLPCLLRPVPCPLILDAGVTAAEKFIEFFTAQIRNRNTREAYARAAGQFMIWCYLV